MLEHGTFDGQRQHEKCLLKTVKKLYKSPEDLPKQI